jgi:hypothetical protein
MSPQEHRPVFINDAEIERRDAEIVRLRRINDVLARLGVDDAKRIAYDAKIIADLNKKICDDAQKMLDLRELVATLLGQANQAFDQAIWYFFLFS